MGILQFFEDCRTRSDRWRGLWRHKLFGKLSPMYCHDCGKFCGWVNDADDGGFEKIVYFCDPCEEGLRAMGAFLPLYLAAFGLQPAPEKKFAIKARKEGS